MTGVTDNNRAKTLTIAESISAQHTAADCRSTFAFVENQSTHLNVSSYGVLIRVSQLDVAQQRVVPAVLRPHSSHVCHGSLLVGHLGRH